jgi:ferritin
MNNQTYQLLNAQINEELYSAYLYLTFADHFEARGLRGFANWYYIQTQEERDHAMLLRRYLLNEGKSPVMEAVAKPDASFKTDLEVLEAALEHERYITAKINAIYKSAQAEDDFRTMQLLDWFVKEQGEEEDNARTQVDQYKLFGSDPMALFNLDRENAARVYAAPSLVL